MSKAKRIWYLALGPVLGLMLFFAIPSLELPARITAAVFALAIFYWVTEVIPLFVTAILAPFLLMLLLGPVARWVGFKSFGHAQFMGSFASPVVVLMFGGFFMARVFSTSNLDVSFSTWLLKRLGKRPAIVLLGVMGLTAFLSMWMSNTATTAIMVAAMLPVVKDLPRDSNIGRSLMLGIPFAANLGGMGTPIGTPPNAIGLGLLFAGGYKISFFGWMVAAMPPMLILLLLVWGLLLLLLPPESKTMVFDFSTPVKSTNKKRVYAVMLVTILLWLTDALHGIPPSIVALVPVLALTVMGVAGKRDIQELSWDVILLIGGGMSMGVAVKETGLSEAIINALSLGDTALFISLSVFCLVITGLAMFMSRTASASILVPLAIAFGTRNPVLFGVTVSLSVSLAMILPVSTPPNAIAYGSGWVRIRDMLIIGLLVAVFGLILTVSYEYCLLEVLRFGDRYH